MCAGWRIRKRSRRGADPAMRGAFLLSKDAADAACGFLFEEWNICGFIGCYCPHVPTPSRQHASFALRGGFRAGRLAVRSLNVARPDEAAARTLMTPHRRARLVRPGYPRLPSHRGPSPDPKSE